MIHQYELNGFRVILDVGSASIHVADELSYEAVRLLDKGLSREEALRRLEEEHPSCSEEEIRECFADIDELISQKKLFTEDDFKGVAEGLGKTPPLIKALCLLVAQGCNLNCTYCFASQGNYHGQAGLMSFETGKRALDFLIENSGKRRNLEVDFFGGEPLLNFDVCRKLVDYARSREKECGKNFRFTLTTNGLGLNDEVIEWANRECYNVVLSLDGRQEVHDRFRKTPLGEGSYSLVVPAFQKLVSSRGGKGYYIRGTYTHYNTDFTNDLFHMADGLGFRELSMEPVVAGEQDEWALRKEDIPVIKKQYEILAKEMLRREKEGKKITFYHYMLDLTNGPCIYKRVAGCGSGTEYLAVTASGELYPCHQFVSDPEYRMGDVWNGIERTEIQRRFRQCNIYTRPACADCWARMYCAGGCSANALHFSGDILGVYETGCELFKKRLECAIVLKLGEELDNLQHADS